MKKIYSVVILFLIFSSCTKEKEIIKNLSDQILSKWPQMSYIEHYGEFKFSSERIGCGNAIQYRFQGHAFVDSTLTDTACISAGLVKVGALNFLPQTFIPYYFNILPYQSYSTAQNIFGSNTVFEIFGNTNTNVPASSLTMYAPKEIEFLNRSCCELGISKGMDLEVEWNEDLNNNEGVLVSFIYDGPLSNSLNFGLPSNSIELRYWVNDNGSFTISKNDFSNFPVGGRVTLLILRGNIGYSTALNGQKYQFQVHSSATHLDYIKN